MSSNGSLYSDSEFGSDYNDSSNSKPPPQNLCKYLSEAQVLLYMNNIIEDVNSVTLIPKKSTSILLNHFNWRKHDLLERYYSKGEDEFFDELDVVNPFKQVDDDMQCDSPNHHENCRICFVTHAAVDLIGLNCGHTYCRQCWDAYLSVKIVDEGMGKTISCPTPECSILIDHDTCQSFLTNARAKKLHQKIMINNFIECNPRLQWCPNPKCDIIIKAEFVIIKATTRTQICSCGTTICCNCFQNGHVPINCNYLKKWNEMEKLYLETATCLSQSTKECPRCKIPIQKIGGCNLVTCRNNICNYNFCWLCMQSTSDHYSSCDSWKQSTRKVSISTCNARVDLQRREFYFNRYMDHKKSLKFEQEVLRFNLEGKREKLQKDGYSPIEVGWLEEALNVLLQCRQTLSYTYAFTYYLCQDNEFFIFQTNQIDLHKSVESLSEYLERGMDADNNYKTMKLQVINRSNYCNQRRISLENHVDEGYGKGSWKFIQNS